MEADLFGTSARAHAIDVLHSQTSLYTREPIVEQVLDTVAWPENGGRLVDTSCGDGAFLGAALKRLLECEPGIADDDLPARLCGWEIHFQAVAEARGNLCAVLVERGYARQRARLIADAIVREGDFLTECRDERFETIVGNPPYLRWMYLPEILREEYDRVLPDHARADMLHSFLDRCAERLLPGGEIALVTADRWLSNENASRLREVVGQRLGVAVLERLDAESAFYRPKLRKQGTPPRVHPVVVVLREREFCDRLLSREPLYAGAKSSSWACSTLGEVATVRLAPWLGTPGIFVVERTEAVGAGLPGDVLVPAMDTDDVRGGVMREPTRVAIRTSPKFAPEAVVQAFLEARLHKMCERGRMNPAWVPPERFDQLDLSQEQLVVPRIAKTLRPIRVRAGVLPINHNLSIVTHGTSSLDEIEEMLVDKRAQEWMEQRANRLENGYLSITTRLLRTLPVSVR